MLIASQLLKIVSIRFFSEKTNY